MSIDHKTLSEGFSVSGQVSLADLEEIKKAGFRSLIINRPDNEVPAQLHAESMKLAAQGIDLQAVYIPMAGQISMEMIEDTCSAIGDLPGPILAYCGSGTRSAALWCLAQVREQGVDAVLQTAADAGYELGHLRPALEQVRGE